MQRLGQAFFLFWFVMDVLRAQGEDDMETMEAPDEMETMEMTGDMEGMEGDEMPEESKLELSEQQLEGLFHAMDKAKTGKIAVADLYAFAKEMRIHANAADTAESYMSNLDTDQDGKVSLDEVFGTFPDAEEDSGEGASSDYTAHEKEKFFAADKNSDGFLDRDEFGAYEWPELDEAVEEAYARSIFERKDKDQDGTLTPAEFYEADPNEDQPEVDDDFKKLDKNGDGSLSLEEAKVWESGRYFTEDALQFVAEHADTDQDGQVTLEEFIAAKAGVETHHSAHYLDEWAKQLEL